MLTSQKPKEFVMTTPLAPLSLTRPAPQLALRCSSAGQLATPAAGLGWRERLLQLVNQIRWSRSPAAVQRLPVGYEMLGDLDEHLLADIGAPESLRERARHCHDMQRQRVLELEHGHRSVGEGRW
jgi:hypothetical protein